MDAKLVSSTVEETKKLGREFSQKLSAGVLVAISGPLGSGKTVLIQGICEGLGVKQLVTSPSFIIINEYPAEKFRVYHFDLYRLKSVQELINLGYEEYFYGNGICLVEWAEKARELLPDDRIEIHLKILSENQREITIQEWLRHPAGKRKPK
ncbi:MAG: tRNA (adenosine(37)-N6)-threonylcarbamoyltransferase complex ATPase subunit type 1 TsaE [candidate division Zixibacteria bacterium RBG_19FT_COMBO_42_43]|nr:MAG: tRNA (adenosine(37)-N6)-threonylcarbamoyltransferase complex ATPase subunit type 1 TsaE [candidate division Zixibacteria bacterium RBG_19FT_COMBO_42_43]